MSALDTRSAAVGTTVHAPLKMSSSRRPRQVGSWRLTTAMMTATAMRLHAATATVGTMNHGAASTDVTVTSSRRSRNAICSRCITATTKMGAVSAAAPAQASANGRRAAPRLRGVRMPGGARAARWNTTRVMCTGMSNTTYRNRYDPAASPTA
jgi:hypothetical protein